MTTRFVKVSNFVSAEHYLKYLPRVIRKKQQFKKIISFVPDHFSYAFLKFLIN